ncbi:MAG: taspase, threonine aspartase, 1, partial [Paramarteilia canceri]
MQSSVVFFCFHLGAGAKLQPEGKKRKVLNRLLKEVLQSGRGLIKAKSNGKSFVEEILAKMENCEYTNAGYGSNLTSTGQPELECAIMGSEKFYYAIAGCSNLKNPSRYLEKIYEKNLSEGSRTDS